MEALEPLSSVPELLQAHFSADLETMTNRFTTLGVELTTHERLRQFVLHYRKHKAIYYPDVGGYEIQFNTEEGKRGRRLGTFRRGARQLARGTRRIVTPSEFVEIAMRQFWIRFEPKKVIYRPKIPEDVRAPEAEPSLQLMDINKELYNYLSRYPDRIYDLTSRRFEELIADILHHFGFEVELTPATRDGGRDIIAYIRNRVISFLAFVECKKFSPTNKVGVEIVRSVYGVQRIYNANKSIIVTTSFFTNDAVVEQSRVNHELELRDYNHVVSWITDRSERIVKT